MNKNAPQSAGKLQLLDLAPLRARVGDKWQRLSTHLERFFETAITRSLAPGDTYTRVNELSYLVLFRGLSIEETRLRCAAISQEICQRLFGEHSVEASLRNLVACFDVGDLPRGIETSGAIDALLERCGMETIVSVAGPKADSNLASPSGGAAGVQDLYRLEFLYRPIWDVINQVVVTYLCHPTSPSHSHLDDDSSRPTVAAEEDRAAAIDLLVLQECARRGEELRAEGFRIVTAVPISFLTLVRSRLWSTYSELFRQIPSEIARDLALVVRGIEDGAPNMRLTREFAKLSTMGRLIFCVTKDSSGAGSRFANTGVRALGIDIDPRHTDAQTIERVKILGQETRKAGLDAFILGVQSTSVALNALAEGIRYLEGTVVGQPSANPRHAFAQSLENLYRL